jgi:hypothetical protein
MCYGDGMVNHGEEVSALYAAKVEAWEPALGAVDAFAIPRSSGVGGSLVDTHLGGVLS